MRNARSAAGISDGSAIQRGLIRLGLSRLAQRFASIGRADYRQAWHREVGDGRGGQRLAATSTWVLDGLWAAACHQIRADEIERLIVDAVETGSVPEFIAVLIDDLAAEWRIAHNRVIENKMHGTSAVDAAQQRDAREVGTHAA